MLHATADRIDERIIHQINNWNGPISLTITFNLDFIGPEYIGCYKNNINTIIQKSIKASKYLAVHYLIQNQENNCNKFTENVKNNKVEVDECKNFKDNWLKFKKDFNNLSLYQKTKYMISYAIQDARNFAKHQSVTKFILIADLDHLFSENFELKMSTFAKNYLIDHPDTVLVYRIFEIKDNVKEPRNNEELKRLLQWDDAREFHVLSKKKSIIETVEKMDEFLDHPDEGDNVTSIQFFKEYKNQHWEPQFVSSVDIPDFDTNFTYPMKDNTMLVSRFSHRT